MQNKDYVYFLSVKEANEIATKHESDEKWDFWTDAEALSKGMNDIVERVP